MAPPPRHATQLRASGPPQCTTQTPRYATPLGRACARPPRRIDSRVRQSFILSVNRNALADLRWSLPPPSTPTS